MLRITSLVSYFFLNSKGGKLLAFHSLKSWYFTIPLSSTYAWYFLQDPTGFFKTWQACAFATQPLPTRTLQPQCTPALQKSREI